MQSETHSCRQPLPRAAICDLITPFRGGDIDRVGLMTLIDWQIRSGISGLVVCGEASEAPTLSAGERALVLDLAMDVADGQVPVIAGTGTNCTEATIALTAAAKARGADAALLTVPYYSRPSQEGIFRHIEAVAIAVDIPLLIANAPARTAVDLAPSTIERLAVIDAVAGLVDCTGDVSRLAQTPAATRQRLLHYSGHDLTACPFTLCGGNGGISMAANVAPRLTSALHNALRTGNVDLAYGLQERITPLLTLLAKENAVASTKHAVSLVLGLSAEVRLPLTPPSLSMQAQLRSAIAPLPERAELMNRAS